MARVNTNSPLKRAIKSFVIGIALLSSGCSTFTARLSDADQSPLLPPGTAKGLSRDAPNPEKGLNFRRAYFGIARQAELDAYLNEILARLQKAYTDIPEPAHVFVVPDSSYSANATEDGAIFVPFGILLDIESEDELAALLAHEYSHVLLGHHITGNAEEIWNYIHGLTNLALRTQLIAQKTLPLLANEAALEMIQSAAIPVLDRSQEDDADKLGTDLLIAAGYNSIGMYELLGRMKRWDELNEEQKKSRESLLEMASDSFKIDSKRMEVDFTPMITGVSESILEARDWLRKKHYDTKERQDTIRDYIKTVHSGAPRPEKRITQWVGVKNSPSVKSFLDGLALMRDLNRSLVKLNAPTVTKLVDKMMTTQAGNVPYLHYSAFKAYKSVGLNAEAIAVLKKDELSPDSLLPQHMELIAIAEKKSADEGLKSALSANQVLGEPPQLMPKLIHLYKKTGNKVAMTGWHAKCVATGVNALMNECDKQAH
ncbi:M48 family metallopeptidase [Methylotuvimicrobium alcaliphilum]|uniref:Peptidase M48 domain-containing protein n=1 Tax=Methylotuvimicrobium alcaliphilum (strain DSM 19304 / NCIMB 14124 / VKM B-2133 / 20Z) TaxID=1091494 RepID=G4SX36_META2|nr:M48 family metallopeptidase [Methylotuvimicrobium alcaliphilum]CCE23091.1 exported protein of unknown function [Methylotuvimicrobium alcaliphilum 20Z]